MKKIIYFGLIIGLAAALIAGCSSSSSAPAQTLNGDTAKTYSAIGTSLAQEITGSMGSWASTGTITGLAGSSIKVKGLNASSVVSQSTSGWVNITGSTSEGSVDSSWNINGKLDTNEAGDVTVSLYGTFTVTTAAFSYTETFGNGMANPYVGTATGIRTASAVMGLSGSISFVLTTAASATAASQTIAMAFTLSDYSVPVTGLADYPTGTMTIATTYNSVAQPNIVLTFNGTATATITYGDYTSTFLVEAS